MGHQINEIIDNTDRLFSLSPYPIFEINQASELISANEAACIFTGYSLDALLSLNLKNIVSDYSPADWQEKWCALKRQGKIEFSGTIYKNSGAASPVSFTATQGDPTRLHNGSANTEFIILSVDPKKLDDKIDRDVRSKDHHKENQKQPTSELEQLTRTVELLTNIINSTPDRIFVKDSELRTIVCNDAFANTVNRNPQDIIGKTDLESGLDWELVKGNAAKGSLGIEQENLDALAGKEVHNPNQIVNVGEEARIFDTRKLPLRDGDGNIIGVIGIGRDITERERALQALQKREELFSKVFRTGPALYTITANLPGHGLFVDVSEAFLSTFGYRRDEIIGRSTKDLNIWVDPELRSQLVKKLQNNATVDYFEAKFRTKSDEIRTCLISTDPIEYQGRSHFLTVFTDISERIRAERELYESEEKFRSIVSNSQPITFVIDTEGRFVFSEGKSLAALNEMPGDAVGKSAFDLYKNHPEVIQGFQQALLGKTYSDIVTVSGITFDTVFTPWRNSDGRVIGAVGMAIDITEHKRIEEALQKSEKRFKDFAESSSDWFWEQDKNLRFIYVSPEVYEKSGVHARDHIGKTERQIALLGVSNEQWRQYELAVKNHRPFREFTFQRHNPKGKLRDFSLSGKPIFDVNGNFTGYRGSGHDITERKRAESALRLSEERFKDFAETAADWFWETDANFRYVFRSNAGYKMTGLSDDTVLGSTRQQTILQKQLNKDNIEQHFQDLLQRREFHDYISERHRADGTVIVMRQSAKPIFDETGIFQGYRGVTRDATESQILAKKLSFQATHDNLTGLINRNEFDRRLQRILDTARNDHSVHALCYLDLDQFKLVNDTCGHVAGDELLRQLGELLISKIRKHDTLGRLGGDEFGLLLEHCSLKHAERSANILREAIENYRFAWENKTFKLGASFGLVAVTELSQSAKELLQHADSACFIAKNSGRNQIHVHREADANASRQRSELQWVNQINQALEENRLRIYAQPLALLNAPESQTSHLELMLRLETEDRQIIHPSKFLPAAERYSLSTKLDRWVIKNAFNQILQNRIFLDNTTLFFINISGSSLSNEEFTEYLIEQFSQFDIPHQKVCFECTETATVSNLAKATKFIHAVRKLGCQFTLNDFGSGISSFAYLKNLSVDYIKIDGRLIQSMNSDPVNLAMVKSINDIGHVMGLKTIAEIVDDRKILKQVKNLNIDFAQGNVVGNPQPINQLLASR